MTKVITKLAQEGGFTRTITSMMSGKCIIPSKLKIAKTANATAIILGIREFILNPYRQAGQSLMVARRKFGLIEYIPYS